MSTIKQTLKQRGNMYGEFKEHARISQTLKAVVFGQRKALTASQTEALEMLCHKLARILNGNTNYIDSWRDMIGYLQLVVDEMEKTDGCLDSKTEYFVIKQDINK